MKKKKIYFRLLYLDPSRAIANLSDGRLGSGWPQWHYKDWFLVVLPGGGGKSAVDNQCGDFYTTRRGTIHTVSEKDGRVVLLTPAHCAVGLAGRLIPRYHLNRFKDQNIWRRKKNKIKIKRQRLQLCFHVNKDWCRTKADPGIELPWRNR